MAHRRIKNIDFDDDDTYDDYDDYDDGAEGAVGAAGDDGLTDDDREQLRLGTIQVRDRLRDYESISDAAIHEALYHYWYDVDKTVVYLKNENRPAEKKQPKAASRFDQAASASAQKADAILPTNGESAFLHDLSPVPTASWPSPRTCTPTNRDNARSCTDSTMYTEPSIARDIFAGMEWSPVPASLQTRFTPVERRPRLCLLGGSGKPSKLAALAAARKAKDAAKKNDSFADAPVEGTEQSLNALSLLDRLGAKDSTKAPLRQNPLLARKAAKQAPVPEVAMVDVSSVSAPETTPAPSQSESQSRDENRDDSPRSPKRKRLVSEPRAVLEKSTPSIIASELCEARLRSYPTTSSSWQSSIALAIFGNTTDHIPRKGFSTLSPDGVVLEAQAKGTSTTPKKATKKQTKDIAKATADVDDLTIDDTPRDRPRVAAKIQSKNLDVPAEYAKNPGKKELNVVIAGHVDHGKSTLMGRLLFESSMVDQRTLDKYRKEATKLGKESFALAWVMDARDDEREHGITIDYSEKVFETECSTITIIDAPGHRDYVGNMIAGTSMADCALLVVDAGTNSFLAGLKGQTREHAQVIRAMKLEKLIVAVNKMDSVSWSRERFDDVCAQATTFLEECLFSASNIAFIPCSGLSGENVSRAPATPDAKWYTGPTLLHALDEITPDRTQYLRPLSAPFRMRITGLAGLSEFSEFASSAAHTPFTVSGRIDSGTVQVGDTLITLPAGEEAVVKSLTRHGKPADWAVAGQLVGLQLSNCDEERFNRGDLLCSAAKPARVARKLRMKILAFATVFPMPVEVHRGRLRAAATVTQVVARLDRRDHRVLREAPKSVKAGEVARVVVEFDEPVALERPGRVVLRYGGETIAAGAVEMVLE